jgi:5-amino-6-(5-phospho-D-ribitylamino)uracil phosphatase
LTKKLCCHYSQDVYSKYQWLDLSHPDSNKRAAAEFLRARLGARRIVAFGDNLNDLPLMEASDEFYAVRNAVFELIERSAGVIASNDEAGVISFLEHRLSP